MTEAVEKTKLGSLAIKNPEGSEYKHTSLAIVYESEYGKSVSIPPGAGKRWIEIFQSEDWTNLVIFEEKGVATPPVAQTIIDDEIPDFNAASNPFV